MRQQLDMIHGIYWDKLIIFDAQRYDFFEENYRDYLDGNLTKVYSPASCTPIWLKRVWTDHYNLTYISGNPLVNSYLPAYGGFDPMIRFSRIIDVWKFGWSSLYHTTPPVAINEAVKMYSSDRLVVHYVQPHLPYIGETKLFFDVLDKEGERRNFNMMSRRTRDDVLKGKITIDFLRQAYRDNVRLVLERFAEILPCLSGRVIITSDHGELLGEHKEYLFHPGGEVHPILREVPWFEVEH